MIVHALSVEDRGYHYYGTYALYLLMLKHGLTDMVFRFVGVLDHAH